ncbi:hypothetical protein [Novosphingobium ginsenosidimutans]|uniref:Uncharacterized protein n=1 Tax=Novosphingobium ginsenosidimutans TaxID=1176536 RepID=A0A5B8S5G8_9SPHN|nr:hypothetical protein [Novosphingobium ginsenosidimutans]QEA16272.1 hypothetical protein FRF71_09080 [Novosphingobium ginsenosidimutans]
MTDNSDLDDLANRFFQLFSRAEGALKASGRLKMGKNNPEADWGTYGAEIDGSLEAAMYEDAELKAAIDYYIDSPPLKQVLKAGETVFEKRPLTSTTKTGELLLYVCRVRNNLFHGAKFNGHWFDPERSRVLLNHGIVIISRSIELSDDVRSCFEAPPPGGG